MTELETLRHRMIVALNEMDKATEMLDRCAASDTFRGCLRRVHELGYHVTISAGPTGIEIELHVAQD